ncbi:adenosylcobinamide amidohydrolase [Nocardioidaceae bacterium]|nr:adenosylcobinamide amidohydrolase [Nocardioidaceae bacterium]
MTAYGLLPPDRGADHRGVLWWRFPTPRPVVSTAAVGGGLGETAWVLNVGVDRDYRRTDLDAHAAQIAASADLAGPGMALFTAAAVERVTYATEPGLPGGQEVQAWATVGVTRPTWPADRAALPGAGERLPGTINVVVLVPAAFTAAALLQLSHTATEARAQACLEHGVAGTGTASDAVVVAGLPPSTSASTSVSGQDLDPFGGVRSWWGARVALAVHAAVTSGLRGASDG